LGKVVLHLLVVTPVSSAYQKEHFELKIAARKEIANSQMSHDFQAILEKMSFAKKK
jgi:hypothetical protein